MFRNVRDANIKEGIYIGLQIGELLQDKQFDENLNETERNAWLSFNRICKTDLNETERNARLSFKRICKD